MFVSIAVDAGSEGRAKELADLLGQYGFLKIQRGLWESADVSPGMLTRLKRDVDRATDAFDRIRFFQFPMEGTLVLSSLREKKWRRMVARDATTPAEPAPEKPRPASVAARSHAAQKARAARARSGPVRKK